MDGASFFICFAGWTLGGIVNGISGLGAGIFALPIVLLVTDIKTASLITCIICIPLPAILGWQFRHHYRLADLRLLFLGTIPGALLGVALLPRIPARALQMGLGIMLMAHMLWHLLAHRPGPLRSPLLWGTASGAVAGFIQAVSGLGGPPIGMYAQLAHWDKDRTRGNISLYFLGLSLPLVLTQYLAGYYTGPVLQGLIPCLLGCGTGLAISYPLARRIGEAGFQRLLAIVIGLSGFSILTRALLDSCTKKGRRHDVLFYGPKTVKTGLRLQFAHGIGPAGHYQRIALVQHGERRRDELEDTLACRTDAHDHDPEGLDQV